jgi:16S rRNA (adenine1518-N6/adenine1519-N6)-dimethyltransferase
VSLPRARKRFAQHFLEPAWVVKVVDAFAPAPADRVVEIGPGRGALTRPLAPRVASLTVVEVDRDLATALEAETLPGVRVVTGDFLTVDLDNVLGPDAAPVRVVANLPYNVASPILFRLLGAADAGRRIRDATLMLQREVADRLLAVPGGATYGAMAIQAGLDADITRVLALPPGAFRPAPKVASSVVRLRFRAPAVDVGDRTVFTRLVRGLFLQRRKTLLNALRPVAGALGAEPLQLIDVAGLDPSQRPQTLTLTDMAALSRAVLEVPSKLLTPPGFQAFPAA